MSPTRPGPINWLTCSMFIILLVAVVVAFGALHCIPLLSSGFSPSCDSMNSGCSPPQTQLLPGFLPNWGSHSALHAGTTEKRVGVSAPINNPELTHDRSGGSDTPALRHPQGRSWEPFCVMSLRPWDLTDTPSVGFYTFCASLPCLLILGIIPQISDPSQPLTFRAIKTNQKQNKTKHCHNLEHGGRQVELRTSHSFWNTEDLLPWEQFPCSSSQLELRGAAD